MKTKELIKKVKELGFRIIKSGSHLDIMYGELIIARVYIDQMYVMSFYRYDEKYLINEDKLFNLIVKYTSTPIDDREEEKKFYLKHRWLKPKPIYKNYLNNWIGTNEYWLDYKNETKDVQTRFTLKEIEEIKEKFNTDLGDFKKTEEEK